MKLCSFKIGRAGRVGVQMKSGKVADVNTGYAALLKSQGHPKAQPLADVITPPCMIGLIESGSYGLQAVKETMAFVEANPGARGPEGDPILYGQDEIKFEAPVPNPSKIFSIAINNRQKFDVAGKPQGEPHPLYFIKVPTCVTGPYDPIEIPNIGIVGSEAEVVAIIGKEGKNIPESEAGTFIFGYAVHNDVTAHELRDTREWIISRRPEGDVRLTYSGRYKCFDTFAPMGPWLVTPDEIPNIKNCRIEARLNGKLVQAGSTGDMYFSMPYLIHYLSEAHTFKPGDIISWGTVVSPPGVNFQKIDLRGSGGVLETEVEHLGCLKNPIKAIP